MDQDQDIIASVDFISSRMYAPSCINSDVEAYITVVDSNDKVISQMGYRVDYGFAPVEIKNLKAGDYSVKASIKWESGWTDHSATVRVLSKNGVSMKGSKRI